MIALRISKEIKDGDYVNLGIGIPTLISNWIEAATLCCRQKSACSNRGRWLQMKKWLTRTVSMPVASRLSKYRHHLFWYCRIFYDDPRRQNELGRHGALQVNDKGDYAGWANPSRGLDVGNIGGSMDLVAGADRLFLAMEHVAVDGNPRLWKNLPSPHDRRQSQYDFHRPGSDEVTPKDCCWKRSRLVYPPKMYNQWRNRSSLSALTSKKSNSNFTICG